MIKRATISNENLEEAYIIMAKIISEGNDKYLPIFKRLNDEKSLRRADDDLKMIAVQAALQVL